MKKILILLAIFTPFAITAQSVGINDNGIAANPSAMLDVSSTTKGFLPPRMTYAQREAIASPAIGLMIYCTNCGTNGEGQLYNGAAWVNLQGETGATGATGPQGIQGETGATGATGPQGPAGSGSAFPIGSVIAYMGNGSNVAGMEANGWFKCDGRNISSLSALSADEITALTNILGGSSNLPDLRGNFLRGLDEGRGFDDDAASRTGGESTTSVRSQQGESMRNHRHSGTTATDGAHIHDVNDSYWGLALQDGNNTNNGTDLDFSPNEMNIQNGVLKNWQVDNTNSAHSHTFTTSDAQNSSTGIIPKAGNENRPDNVAVYWLIRGK